MSARKPATQPAAAAATTAAAKSDNNNVATSPTLELEATAAGDETATDHKTTTTTTVADKDVDITGAADEDEQRPPEKPKEKERTPDHTAKDCSSPRKSLTDTKILRNTRLSSPLLLGVATTAGGATSEGEEQPSNSQSGQRKGSTDRQIIRGRKSIKEMREAKLQDELNVKEELASNMEAEEESEAKDVKDNVRSMLDSSKDKEKEATPTPAPTTATPVSTPATTCNRVTRKAHAQELAMANHNTRVTRNRRQSSTVNEPQLPARGRRKKPAMLKRKRSNDDASESNLSLKYTKMEMKEEDDDHDSLAGDDVGTVTPSKSSSALNIKLELPDTEDTPELPSPAVQQASTASRRGRGRPQTRTTPVTTTGSTTSNSSGSVSSTRATRHSKAGSPLASTPTEPTAPKRRRVGSSNRSLLVVAKAMSQGAGVDEDSKDSLASSSMDDLLLPATEIKQEKITIDFEESLDDAALATKSTDSEPVEEKPTTTNAASCSNGIEPLTVDTDAIAVKTLPVNELEQKEADEGAVRVTMISLGTKADEGDTASANDSQTGKAPSLSPEMISEGVSAISVKQFYKKPEFLANNLGIEKDPELGEIVQIVTETQASTEVETEAETEVEAEVVEAEAEGEVIETEIESQAKLLVELETDVEAKQEDSYSTGMSELRVDESGDEITELLDEQKKTTMEQETTAGEEATTTVTEEEKMPAAVAVETISSPGELNGETEQASKADDYDDFESEIMEQLAKEGVVDASGNALSASKPSTLDEPTTPSCDTLNIDQHADDVVNVLEKEKDDDDLVTDAKKAAEVGLALEVTPYGEEQEAEANAEADDDADAEMQMLSEDCVEYPEENKENVSTVATDSIVVTAVGNAASCESSMDVDIDLALKSEDNPVAAKLEQDEVKPKLEESYTKKPVAEQKIATTEPKLEANGDDESLRREKELHLQHLGLLTHQAAEQLRQEYIQEAHTRAVHQQQQQQHHQSGKRSAGKGNTHIESSGTLKTVIKLNRSSNGGSGGAAAVPTGVVIHGAAAGAGSAGGATTSCSATRKGGIAVGGGNAGAAAGGSSVHGVRRQSLKMTFQKGRARGHGAADRTTDQHGAHAEDYYTIQNENEGASKSNANPNLGNAGRKTTNRLSSTNYNNNNNLNGSNNNKQQQQQLQQQQQKQQLQQQQHNKHSNDSSHSEGQGGQLDHSFYQMVKKDEKEKILIPEKASSFKFHPGRLCEDQCYYCSGKFGLYDTPCHVGQIKSVERQQKILANEEKLTVDNCLCDACFRHVDRRANAPSYKKRISAPGHLESSSNNNNNGAAVGGNSLEKHHYAGDAADAEFATTSSNAASATAAVNRNCAVKDCADGASHSLRRKCVRKSVKKCLLNFEIPVGTSSVWLCEPHYNTVIQSSGCVLCKRRLGKNHMYHITSDTDRLEKALAEMGIPVQLGVGTAVCKLCRYFANLLMKPPDSTKSQKAEFVKNYRKRLLKVHNLQDGSNEVSEADDEDVRASTNSAIGVSSATSSADCDKASTDVPMVVDYDGPATDSNSSSSSSHGAARAASKQMSKLQAILQQNLAGETTTTTTTASATTVNVVSGGSKEKSGAAAADISNVLRGNPNISMRELFHGEEELGVQFKVPFGCSSSQRTPEGWTRVQTFLQYDEPTRRLWEELQKPYGNQSSFLRHLILLEKYYRNGDLVLAPHASPNANVYTQTVRQRLNSYDHGHCGGMQSNAKPTAVAAGGQSPTGGNSGNSSSSSSSNAIQLQANASGSSASVLANALISAHQSQSSVESILLQQQPAPSQEAVIPLVELNDDDDDDDDDEYDANNHKEEDVEYTPLERLRNVSVDKLTKQLSSNAVTITARPKESRQTLSVEETTTKLLLSKDAPPLVPTSSAAANSRSILKTNLLNKTVELLPLTTAQQQQQQQQQHQHQSNHKPATNASSEKSHKLLDMASQLARSHLEQQSVSLLALQQQQQQQQLQQQKQKPLAATAATAVLQSAKSATTTPATNVAQLLSSPPELISLQRRRTSGAHATSASAGVNSATPAVAAAAAAAAVASVPTLAGKRLQLPRAGGGGSSAANVPSVIMLPDSLSPQERHDSKSWKPTLIPLKEQHKVPNKSPTLFQTADGRRLPAQVQVQSGGKPYLISIIDYNRMCILRREKLMRDQMLKANAKSKTGQQMQQQQQQHSSYANLSSKMAAAHQTARQQLHQLQQQQQQQQQQKQQQLPTLQPGGHVAGNSGLRLARLAPKPMPPLSNPQQNATTTGNNSSSSTSAITTQSTNYQPMLVNALAAAAAAAATGNSGNVSLDNNTSWLWKNYPDHSQFLLNGNGSGAGSNKLPHLASKPAATSISGGGGGGGLGGSSGITFTLKQQQQQQQQQKLIDNVIMSKIPKSLTVIPQHMGGGGAAGGVGGVGDVAGGSKE